MKTIIIDCDECVMRATGACSDCLVTYVLDTRPAGHSAEDACPKDAAAAGAGSSQTGQAEAIVFDLAEQRAVRWFAEAGLVPTLRHRAASNS